MRFLSLIALVVAAPTLAQAADYLPPAPPLPYAGPAAEFNWGGLYGGIHAGVTTADFKTKELGRTLVDDAYYAHIAHDLASTFVRLGRDFSDQQPHLGGFVGYNMMFEDAVFGLELDYTHMKDKLLGQTSMSDGRRQDRGTYSDNISYTASARAEMGDYAILKARGGYAFGRFLPFATVGLVVGRQRLAAALNSQYTEYLIDPDTGRLGGINVGPTPRNSSIGKTGYNYGGAIGLGLDVAVLDNVMLRAEYQYIGMASYQGLSTAVSSFRVGAGVKY
ncbi:outer membrane protein [Alsobacter sp. SYSU BS001988]|jgi:opacity protein-like surface antigen